MLLPRLIIADEHRAGKLSSGVLIASVLKAFGYKLKPYVGNVDDTTLCALQAVCGQPVTMIDPTLCEAEANVKWLFQSTASPDCINFILVNLGHAVDADTPIRVSKECALLSKWLDCGVIPVIAADASSSITVNKTSQVVAQLEKGGGRAIAFLFRAVLNSREFELVDREVGRRFSVSSIGFMSETAERPSPKLLDLVTSNVKSALLPIKSVSLQLKNNDQMICWPVFYALSLSAPDMARQPALAKPIDEAGKVNIAVIKNPITSLGGDGTERLMKILGCNIVDVSLDGRISQNVAIHGVYVPYGLTHIALEKLLGNRYLKALLSKAAGGMSFLLAEGPSAALFGERIKLPSGVELDGLGLFRFECAFSNISLGSHKKFTAKSKKANPLISGSQEWVYGYTSSTAAFNGTRVEEETARDECWELSDSPNSKPVRRDGWAKHKMLATSMRIEPWGTPETFARWLNS
ncbi:hypothetical protein FACS1894216_03850 [Synergistales bacterium]|nr:hypothetical protein FACS1894216_03850 [Synergistales bacterium]